MIERTGVFRIDGDRLAYILHGALLLIVDEMEPPPESIQHISLREPLDSAVHPDHPLGFIALLDGRIGCDHEIIHGRIALIEDVSEDLEHVLLVSDDVVVVGEPPLKLILRTVSVHHRRIEVEIR